MSSAEYRRAVKQIEDAAARDDGEEKWRTPKNNWVWILVGLVNLPAFLMLIAALIGKVSLTLDRPLPHSWNFTVSLVLGLGVWLEYFLFPLSLYIGFTLNHEVDERYRGWTWFVVFIAGCSFVLALRIVRS